MTESLHFYLDTLFGLLLGASVINLLLWLEASLKFKRLILEGGLNPRVGDGRPSPEHGRYYSLRKISGGLPLVGYLIKGNFMEIEHTPLMRLAKRLRIIIFLQAVIFVPFFAIFSELTGSAQWSGVGPDLVSDAYELYGKGRYEDAEKLLNRLLKDDPGNPDGHYYRAFVLEKLGRYQEALEDFKRAAEAKPDHFDIFLHIDYLLTRQHQWSEVVRFWNIYIDNQTTDARAYLERGGAYWQMGNLEEAMQDAHKACELGSDKGCARYEQARSRIESM